MILHCYLYNVPLNLLFCRLLTYVSTQGVEFETIILDFIKKKERKK